MMRVGVLALQGDFALHAAALARAGATAVEVRKPGALDDVEGLVIPGGESTTLLHLMRTWGFLEAIPRFHASGRPLFGTCAGLIVLAREVENPGQPSLGLIDVGVQRNAYGRQRESFEVEGEVRLDAGPVPLTMVFIRAPRITRVGPGVDVLGRHGDAAVMACQGSVLVSTFHPEMTDDPSVHRHFCAMARHAHAR